MRHWESCVPHAAETEFRSGLHQLGDRYKLALYWTHLATDKNRHSTVYTSLGEIAEGNGYIRGGLLLKGFRVEPGPTLVSSEDPHWPGSFDAVDGAVIYNASKGNRVLMIFDFSPVTCTNGGLTVEMDRMLNLADACADTRKLAALDARERRERHTA